jgi:hypothetical protein
MLSCAPLYSEQCLNSDAKNQAMPTSDDNFEKRLIAVWRQALAERKRAVELDAQTFPVRRTLKRGLLQIDFTFDGREIRGLEQNPDTKSRWAQLARAGKKVMQFLEGGRYVANVVDGELTWYGISGSKARSRRGS